MVLCLEKKDYYAECIEQLKKCHGFSHQEYFFRKYAYLLIDRIYKKIDKQPADDGHYFNTNFAPERCFFDPIITITKC
jgi:hypothetical protein